MTRPRYWDEAVLTLARQDRILRKLIRAYPDMRLTRRSDAFTALARSIVGQQISVKAAAAVWRRFVVLVAPDANPNGNPKLHPATVAAVPLEHFRGCGFSQRKAEYVRDLAGHFVSGALDPKRWKKLDDEALIEALVDVKGIGRWTAEMFLIFHELRPDVWPVGDLGLQNAVAKHYNGGERLLLDELRELAEPWRPYRSVATWYLWRSLDPEPVEY